MVLQYSVVWWLLSSSIVSARKTNDTVLRIVSLKLAFGLFFLISFQQFVFRAFAAVKVQKYNFCQFYRIANWHINDYIHFYSFYFSSKVFTHLASQPDQILGILRFSLPWSTWLLATEEFSPPPCNHHHHLFIGPRSDQSHTHVSN